MVVVPPDAVLPAGTRVQRLAASLIYMDKRERDVFKPVPAEASLTALLLGTPVQTLIKDNIMQQKPVQASISGQQMDWSWNKHLLSAALNAARW